MELQPVNIAVMIGYLALMLAIGFYSMKQTDSFDDYAVAGRRIPAALIFATVAATLCGGGATIGRIAYIHNQGMIVFVGLMGVVIGQLFSGVFVAPRVREAGKNIYGIGDLFGMYYGRGARLASSVISFFFCIGAFGVQILAMGRILQTVTGIELVPAAIISTLITLCYTYVGGYLAVVLTDAVQFVIIAFSLTLTAIIGINAVGGLENAMAVVAARSESSSLLLDFFRSDWSGEKLFAFFLAFMFGEMCAPFYIQRYASAKSVKDTKWGVSVFALYYIFFLATTGAIGVCSLYLQPDIVPDLALSTLVYDLLPVGLSGLAMAGLLAAVMSSSDSFINTAAIIFTRDIYNEFINREASQKKLLFLSKITTLIVGVLGIILALNIPDVFKLMLVVFNFWGPTILPPLLVALLWGKVYDRKISPYAGAPAIIIALIVTHSWNGYLGLSANVAGILASILTLAIIHIATNAHRPTEGMFAPEMLEKNS